MLWSFKNIAIMKGLSTLRIIKLRQKLAAHDIQGILITSAPNIYYLSGFTGTNAILFITQHDKYLFTDFRYVEQAKSEASDFELVRADKDVLQEINKLANGITTIGLEEKAISLAQYRELEKSLNAKIFKDASFVLQEMRQVKDEQEIEILKQAIKITDQAFDLILPALKPGVTEEEISLKLEYSLRKLGASGKSFDYIVASGQRSALPHGVATAKKIETGDLVTLDFGAKYQWYCSDFTRTVFVGKPDAKHQEIYDIVLRAQLTALEAIRPGLTGREVDAVARDIIARAGYGEYFGHGLGHSLGLEIHEPPSLNTREEKVLQPGMVITVEPGIYLPGWGGVRIEDVVLVTNSGAEVLTQASKQFIIID